MLGVLERVIRRHVLAHEGFEVGKIVRRERSREQEVVIEAIVRGRPDAKLRIREHVQHGRGQYVRGRVPHAVERVVHGRESLVK